jgi:3-oxoacyl-[acyl-carrier protein] reductase
VDLRLSERVCVVTGSTGGIGLATVMLLVEEGAQVVTSGRSHAPNVGEGLHVSADLSAPEAPANLIEAAAQAFGQVDVLVNNVGTAYITSFEEVSDGEWEEMWQLNVMSYVRAIRAVVPHMRERGSGSIVNVSSTAGKRPSTGMPHYSVTKAAVLSLSRLVADLYAKHGIRCNAVAPGPTATDAWLGDPWTVRIDTLDAETGLRERDRQWQADVAEADDGDAGVRLQAGSECLNRDGACGVPVQTAPVD